MFFLFWADNCFRDDSNIVGGKDPKNANLGDAWIFIELNIYSLMSEMHALFLVALDLVVNQNSFKSEILADGWLLFC